MHKLAQRREQLALAGASLALLAITWLDTITGELGLFVFYFIPVALAAWYISRRAGLCFALASGACWYLSDRLAGTAYGHPLLVYWETLMRLVSYTILALALSKIRSIVRRQQELLRAVSHDLRSPLSALTGQAQLLAARSEPGSFPALRAGAILRAAQAMAAMIDDLVDAARHESRQLRLELEPVELRPFLEELLERMGPALPCERVDLRLRGEHPAAWADPARLERIVVNLLSNALRYSPAPARVEVEVEAHGDEVSLAVVDHGPGIAPEDLPHLFDEYYRGRASAGIAGVGLGLHSTRLLVLAHGGRLRVEPSPGGGATFVVELPAARAHAPVQAARGARAAGRRS